MSRKRKPTVRCSWCGKEIESTRRSVTKFCNASCRAMFWRWERVVTERTLQATKHINRVAELLAYDASNHDAGESLKGLKKLIDWYLLNGWPMLVQEMPRES